MYLGPACVTFLINLFSLVETEIVSAGVRENALPPANVLETAPQDVIARLGGLAGWFLAIQSNFLSSV